MVRAGRGRAEGAVQSGRCSTSLNEVEHRLISRFILLQFGSGDTHLGCTRSYMCVFMQSVAATGSEAPDSIYFLSDMQHGVEKTHS